MLAIYKTTELGLEKIDTISNGAWVHVVNPTQDEIEKLIDWDMDLDFINYSLDQDEIARMERDEEYTFILLRIPVHNPESDIPYTTAPLGIMILGNKIVTVCRQESNILNVLAGGKYRLLKTGKRYRFALYLFLETSVHYLNFLREINHATELVEGRLRKSPRNREVLELLKYQKSLTYFATALRSNGVMMERVQKTQLFNSYEEDQDLLEDVLTENQQAIQMTGIAAEILSGMMNAFASIISNNLNGVMKTLAALAIILNVSAIVVSLYSVNVSLPGQERPLVFLIVIGLSLVLTAAATYFFYKKDWL